MTKPRIERNGKFQRNLGALTNRDEKRGRKKDLKGQKRDGKGYKLFWQKKKQPSCKGSQRHRRRDRRGKGMT